MNKKNMPNPDAVPAAERPAPGSVTERRVIPVVQESAHVIKRVVDRGSVKVSKIVSEHEEVIPIPTVHDEIEIEHVARDKWLKRPAKTRREGDTIIIPVMEEVTVTEKRLILREEIYIRRRQVTVPAEEKVTLRREQVRIEDNRDRTRRR
jgi:uncharacterized protein (TIGR02271 family)